jgi:hypothetical protein
MTTTLHPIYDHVVTAAEAEFENDRRLDRKKRDPAELANFRGHIALATKLTAEAAAEALGSGNLSAMDNPATLQSIVEKKLLKRFPVSQRLNPFAQTLIKKAGTVAVRLALQYLKARFPLITLVTAPSVLSMLRDITNTEHVT